MKLLKAIIAFILLGVSVSGFSQNSGKVSVADSDKVAIELTVNNEKISIPFTSLNTKVNVFSVIGSKVLSVTIKAGIPEDSITLPKGYYILKMDNITRKIAVK
jgi:p-aminobenzoyl-glutamate transporter AbgT